MAHFAMAPGAIGPWALSGRPAALHCNARHRSWQLVRRAQVVRSMLAAESRPHLWCARSPFSKPRSPMSLMSVSLISGLPPLFPPLVAPCPALRYPRPLSPSASLHPTETLLFSTTFFWNSRQLQHLSVLVLRLPVHLKSSLPFRDFHSNRTNLTFPSH